MLTFVMRRHAGEIPRGATVSEGVGCTAIGRTPLSERAILGLWSHYRHHEPWTPALTLVPLRLWAHIAWRIITVLIDAALTIVKIIFGLIAGAFLLTAFTDTGRGR